ncbi:MAG: glycosyltransferase family 2 protein [Patescibacteria group bacterium]
MERSDTGGLQKEIVIVDDASTDGTTEVLREYESQYRVIRHPRNRGKGAALRTGFMAATGDIVLVQDADLEYNPDDYPKLIAPILEGKADAVYGSRFMGGQAHRVLYFWHYVGNKFLTTLSNMFTNLNLTDMETGYKAFRHEVIWKIAPKLRSDRFGFEPEVTARLAKAHARIYEVGISYEGRTYAEGKKIGWKDGVKAIFAIIYFNLFDR